MSPSNRSLMKSLWYDATDQRLRAIWRILIPVLVATLIYIAGLIGLQQLVGEHPCGCRRRWNIPLNHCHDSRAFGGLTA